MRGQPSGDHELAGFHRGGEHHDRNRRAGKYFGHARDRKIGRNRRQRERRHEAKARLVRARSGVAVTASGTVGAAETIGGSSGASVASGSLSTSASSVFAFCLPWPTWPCWPWPPWYDRMPKRRGCVSLPARAPRRMI